MMLRLGPLITTFLLVLVLYRSRDRRLTISISKTQHPGRQQRRLKALGHFHGIFSNAQADENVLLCRQRRAEFRLQCQAKDKDSMEKSLKRWFIPSHLPDTTGEANLPVEPCSLVFIDLGANVGDSLGKFIDAGLPSCPEVGNSRAYIDVNHGLDIHPLRRSWNRLSRWVRNSLNEASEQIMFGEESRLQPEQYCYFGVEGNPAFSENLKSLERLVMRSKPRPVRRVHYFVDTVVSARNGNKTFYLDTSNAKENYWGSSILSEHRDVRNSDTKVNVNSLTLTSLLNQTVRVEPGAHVMIKMDVEGAEYEVLNEAFDSGLLCELTRKAVRIDLIVEVHGLKVIGENESSARFHDEVRHKLRRKCDVGLQFVLDADG